MAISRDGRLVASITTGRAVEVWDMDQGKLVHTIDNPKGFPGWAVTVTPDGLVRQSEMVI